MPSISTPGEYWSSVVSVDVEQHLEDRANIRKAFHAAVSLYHVWDWGKQHAESRNEKWPDHKSLYAKCPEFATLQDLANAFKHLKLNPKRRKTNISGASEVQLRTGAFQEGAFDADAFDMDKLELDIDETEPLQITSIIRAVHSMWQEELQKRGWI